MRVGVFGVAIAALFVSACAHSYPDLATFKPTSGANELKDILDEAMALQAKYSTGYKSAAKWQDWSQLPVIGGAAAAAWVLLNDKSNAATKAAKTGIGAASFSAARGQLTAIGLPDAYIAGHGALTCILSEGSHFHGVAADVRYRALTNELTSVATRLHEIIALRYREPANVGAHADMLRLARTMADQAIAAARVAETAALTQEGNYLGAAPTFRNAVSNVSVRVASKGRVRVPVDFEGLRNSMAPPKVPTGDAALETIGGRPVVDDPRAIILALTAATEKMMSATARLIGATPDYSKSLEHVRECPKLVS